MSDASNAEKLKNDRAFLCRAISRDMPFVGSTLETYLRVAGVRPLNEGEAWHFNALQDWQRRHAVVHGRIMRSSSFEWFAEEFVALGNPPAPREEIPQRPQAASSVPAPDGPSDRDAWAMGVACNAAVTLVGGNKGQGR